MGNTKQEQTTNEIVPVITEIKDIGSLVYVIRGKQVMIDSDLAKTFVPCTFTTMLHCIFFS